MQTSLKFAAFGALVSISACASSNATPQPIAVLTPPQIDDPYFVAAAERLAQTPSTGRTRNVIIFIGDGMGISTVTASRIFAGQRAGRDGESNQLTMDTFPHTALSRTYGNDAQVSDSAPTATALLSGVKANNGVIGLTSAAPPELCDGSQAYISQSLFEMAEAHGLATGIVSTARITHRRPPPTRTRPIEIGRTMQSPLEQAAQTVSISRASWWSGRRATALKSPSAAGGRTSCQTQAPTQRTQA
jgi:alkaline phosphatase